MAAMIPRLLLLLSLGLVATGCKPVSEEHWRPFGDTEAVLIRLSPEARQLLNQFPLVQILDETLDLTTDIVIFKVRDADGKTFELFYRYWDQKWMKRTVRPDGSYKLEDYHAATPTR